MKLLTATPNTSNPLSEGWVVIGSPDHAQAVADTTKFAVATLPDASGNTYYAHVEDLSKFYTAYTYVTQNTVGLRASGTDTTKYNTNDGTNYASTGGDYFAYVNDISNIKTGQMGALLEGLQSGQVAYSSGATSPDAYYSEWIEVTNTGMLPAVPTQQTLDSVRFPLSATLYPQGERDISAPLVPNFPFYPLPKNSNMLVNQYATAPNPYNVGNSLGNKIYIAVSGDSSSLTQLGQIFPDATALDSYANPVVTRAIIGVFNSTFEFGSTISATYSGSSTNVTVSSTLGIVAGMTVTGNNIPANTTVVSVTNSTTFVISNTPTGSGTSLTFGQSLTGFSIGQSLSLAVTPQNGSVSEIPTPMGWNCGVITAIDYTNLVITTDLTQSDSRDATLPTPASASTFTATAHGGGNYASAATTYASATVTLTGSTTANIAAGALVTAPASVHNMTVTVAAAKNATTLTVNSTTNIAIGMGLQGPNIPSGTHITNILSSPARIVINQGISNALGVGSVLQTYMIPSGAYVGSVLSSTQFTLVNSSGASLVANSNLSGRAIVVGGSPTLTGIPSTQYNLLSAGSTLTATTNAFVDSPYSSANILSKNTNTYQGSASNNFVMSSNAASSGTITLSYPTSGTILSNVSFTTSSTTVTMGNTSGAVVGMFVLGAGIKVGTTISAINPNVSITLSQNPVASISGENIVVTNALYDFRTGYTGSFQIVGSTTSGSSTFTPTVSTAGGLVNGYTVTGSNFASNTTISDLSGAQQGITNGYVTLSNNATATSSTSLANIGYTIPAPTAYAATTSNTVRLRTPTQNVYDCELFTAPYTVSDTYNNPNHGSFVILPISVTNIKSAPLAQIQTIAGYTSADGSSSSSFAGIPVYGNVTSGSANVQIAQKWGVTIGAPISGDHIYQSGTNGSIVGNNTNNNLPQSTVSFTGDLAVGSNTILNVFSTTNLLTGMTVTNSSGLPSGTVITGFGTDSNNSPYITVSNNATVTSQSATLTGYYYTLTMADAVNTGTAYNSVETATNVLIYISSSLVYYANFDSLANLSVTPSYTFTGTTTNGSANITAVSATDIANLSVGMPVAGFMNYGYSNGGAPNQSASFIGSISGTTISLVDNTGAPILWDNSQGTAGAGLKFTAYTSIPYTHSDSRMVVIALDSPNTGAYYWLLDDSYQRDILNWSSGVSLSGFYNNGDPISSVYPFDASFSHQSAITTPSNDGFGSGVVMFASNITGNHVANTVFASYDEGNRYFGSTTVGDIEIAAPVSVGSLFGTTLANDVIASTSQYITVNPLPNTTSSTSPYNDQYGGVNRQGIASPQGAQVRNCSFVKGASEITVSAVSAQTAGITVGWLVTGTGIPTGTYVTYVRGTTVGLSNPVTLSSPTNGATLTITAVVWGVMVVGTGDTQESILFNNTPSFLNPANTGSPSQGNSTSPIVYSLARGQQFTFDHFVGEPVVVANITTDGFTNQHAKDAPVLGTADNHKIASQQIVATNANGGVSNTIRTQLGINQPWLQSGSNGVPSFGTTLSKSANTGDTSLTVNNNDLFPSSYPTVYTGNIFATPELGIVAGMVPAGSSKIPYVPTGEIPKHPFYISIADDIYRVKSSVADHNYKGGHYLLLDSDPTQAPAQTPTQQYTTTQNYADLTAIHLDSFSAGDTYNSLYVPHFYLNRSFAGTVTAGSNVVTIANTLTTITDTDPYLSSLNYPYVKLYGSNVPTGAVIQTGSITGGGNTGGTFAMGYYDQNQNFTPAYATTSGTFTFTLDASLFPTYTDTNGSVYQSSVSTLYTTPIPYVIPAGTQITLSFGSAKQIVTTTADTTQNSAQISVTPFQPTYTFDSLQGEDGVLVPITNKTVNSNTPFGTVGSFGLKQTVTKGDVLVLGSNGNYQQVTVAQTIKNINTALSITTESFTANYAYDNTASGFTFTANTSDGSFNITTTSGASNLQVGQQIYSTTALNPSAFVTHINGTTVTLDSAVKGTATGITFTVYPTTLTFPQPMTLDSGDLAETVIPAIVPTKNTNGTWNVTLSSGITYPHTANTSLSYYAQPNAPQVGDVTYRADLDTFQTYDGYEWHDAAIVEVSTVYSLQGASGGGDKTSFYLVDPTTGAKSAPDIVINAPKIV